MSRAEDDNAFAVLGLAPRYGLSEHELERLQREKYAERSAEGQLALERVNEAYRILRDPVARAELLFELLGWPKQAPPNPELLAWAFEERDSIEQAALRGDGEALWDWIARARSRRDALISALEDVLDGHGEPTAGESSCERAILGLDELRYLSRALSAAQQAAEAVEASEP